MKQNLLKGILVTFILCLTNAHADYVLHSSEANACMHLPGHWTGLGSASSWMVGTCVYRGVGTVSPISNNGVFTIEVTADKESGSFICPSHATEKLSGTCTNGLVTISTEYGSIGGHFSENSGSAKGTVTVSPGVYADVDIEFQRQ